MENMLTYAQKNLRTFREEPLCETDILVLSWLSYLRFECFPDASSVPGCPLKHLYRAEIFEELLRDNPRPEESKELLCAVCASPRFRDIRVMSAACRFAEGGAPVQFAAVTFRIARNLIFVAYRGTDTSFAGWKEDFELALTETIPAQKLAVEYLEEAAERYHGSIIVAGHSKGGNLAVYAAANCPRKVQDRIGLVYSLDGPGFLKSELEREGFQRIQNRISKLVPQWSLFGLLFEQECEYRVVESNALGVEQHDPFTWVLEDDGSLKCCERVRTNAQLLGNKINNWIESLGQEERRRFITGVFSLVESTGARTLGDFEKALKTNLPAVLKAASETSRDMQRFLLDTLRLFLFSSMRGDSPDPPFRFPWEETGT